MAITAVVAFDPSKRPSHLAKREGRKQIGKGLGSSQQGKRISIKAGVFRLIADGKEVGAIEERYLDVVIVNTADGIGRVFYKAKFSEANSNQAPVCWSTDGNMPHLDSSERQSITCATCPQNIKGSGTGDSRACRYNMPIAVVLANDIEGGDVMKLAVPGASLFGKGDGDLRPLQAYNNWLNAQDVQINEVVTRMRFDTKADAPKLYFRAMRYLEVAEQDIVDALADSKEAIDAITIKFNKAAAQVEEEEPFESPKPAVQKFTTKVLPKPAPILEPETEEQQEEEPPAPPPKKRGRAAAKPVEAEVEADAPVEEPKVRREAEKPELPKTQKMADLVSKWQTDDE